MAVVGAGDGWEDLGDDELLRRLVQRGMEPGVARRLVDRRETGQAARAIAQRLAR